MHFLLRGVIIGILFLLSSRLARNQKGPLRTGPRAGMSVSVSPNSEFKMFSTVLVLLSDLSPLSSSIHLDLHCPHIARGPSGHTVRYTTHGLWHMPRVLCSVSTSCSPLVSHSRRKRLASPAFLSLSLALSLSLSLSCKSSRFHSMCQSHASRDIARVPITDAAADVVCAICWHAASSPIRFKCHQKRPQKRGLRASGLGGA